MTHIYTYHGPPVALQLVSGRIVEVSDGDRVEADEEQTNPSLTASKAKADEPASRAKKES